MEFKTLEELVEKGKQLDKKIVMAVPAAEGDYVIETVTVAKKEGLADSILIGNRAKLEEIMQKMNVPTDVFRIVEAETHEECAKKAVELINSGCKLYPERSSFHNRSSSRSRKERKQSPYRKNDVALCTL